MSLLLVGGASASRAFAGEFAWSAPPECPVEAQVRADIERLGGVALDDGALTVRGTAVHEGGGAWRVDLAIAGRDGVTHTRRVVGASCREVADATALIVALALGTPAPLPAPVERPEPPIPRRGEPAEVDLAPIASSRADSPERVAWSFGATTGLDVGALPQPALGFGVAGGLALGPSRFELRVGAWLPRSAAIETPSIGVSLVEASLRYCHALLARDTDSLESCGAIEAGVLRASSSDPHWSKTGQGWWLAPEIGLLATHRAAAWLAIAIEVDALVPLARDRFFFGGAEVHRAASTDGRVLLALRFTAP